MHAKSFSIVNRKLWNYIQPIDFLAGGILIVSALFKSTSPNESLELMVAYGIPSWSSLLLIQLELFLGILLVTNVAPKLACILGVTMFVSCACFSAYRAMAGFESCGCFGAMRVHPWFTFAMDVLLVVLLTWRLRRTTTTQKTAPHTIAFAIASYLFLGGLVLTISHAFQPQTLATIDDTPTNTGNLVVLEPENWSGRKLPIASSLSPKVDLSIGNWTLLLYHYDCPNCQAALPAYEQLAQHFLSKRASRHVALIEVPPYGPVVRHGAAMWLHLSDKVEWFVQAPVEIQISDGIVTGSSRDLPSIATRREIESRITARQLLPISLSVE